MVTLQPVTDLPPSARALDLASLFKTFGAALPFAFKSPSQGALPQSSKGLVESAPNVESRREIRLASIKEKTCPIAQ